MEQVLFPGVLAALNVFAAASAADAYAERDLVPVRHGLWWGALAFAGPLVIYAASLPDSVAFWDTGEMQTVPYILGIAHPTGFPLFVVLGWAFTHVFAFGTVAWRTSLFCAIAMALAARLVYSFALLFDVEAPLAALGSMLFAVGDVAWSRGTRAEVHALAVLFAAAALVAAARWYKLGERRALWQMGLALGFGLATHLVIALLTPGIALILVRRWKELRAADYVRIAAAVLLPLSLYAYLPLRSAYVYAHRADPTLALGIPPGRPYWDYAHPASAGGLTRELAGSDFDVGHGLGGPFRLSVYGRILTVYGPKAAHELSTFGLALALFGLILAAPADPLLIGGLVLAAFLPVPFALGYRAESDVDRYFLTSYWLLAGFAAIGASRGAAVFSGKGSRAAPWGAAIVLAVCVVALVVFGRDFFGQRDDREAADYVTRIIKTTPPRAILIASWAYATPLAYAAYVEHRMQQRIVETAWVGDDEKYLKGWIREYPVYVIAPTMPDVKGIHFTVVDSQDPMLFRATE